MTAAFAFRSKVEKDLALGAGGVLLFATPESEYRERVETLIATLGQDAGYQAIPDELNAAPLFLDALEDVAKSPAAHFVIDRERFQGLVRTWSPEERGELRKELEPLQPIFDRMDGALSRPFFRTTWSPRAVRRGPPSIIDFRLIYAFKLRSWEAELAVV